jgi:hypothetical protein
MNSDGTIQLTCHLFNSASLFRIDPLQLRRAAFKMSDLNVARDIRIFFVARRLRW